MNPFLLDTLRSSLEALSMQPHTDYVPDRSAMLREPPDDVWLEVSSFGEVRLRYLFSGQLGADMVAGRVRGFRMGLSVCPQAVAELLSTACWSLLTDLVEDFSVVFHEGDHLGSLGPSGRLAEQRLEATLALAVQSGLLHLTSPEIEAWQNLVEAKFELTLPRQRDVRYNASARGTLRDPFRVLH